jgi:hypothetical protein
MKSYFKSITKIIAVILLIAAATLSYTNNYFSFSKDEFYSSFDRSEILVLGKIIADNHGIDRQGWNLGFALINGEINPDDNYKEIDQGATNSDHDFSPYRSQFGVQGALFSKIYRVLEKPNVKTLHAINAGIFAIIVTALTFLYARIYDRRFAAIFFITSVTSPWVVAFAKDLYWVPFTWFLPAVFAALAYLNKNIFARAIFFSGIAVAVFIKSLAGYEYLTTITLFTCSVFVVAPFFREGNKALKDNAGLFICAFLACIIGFVCALLLHASMRGDSILSGLKNIYELDVKRRTYGDPNLFDPIFRQSLESSWLDNISIYWNDWATNVFEWLPDISLSGAACFITLGFIYCASTRQGPLPRYLVMLSTFFLVTISWFVFGKAHSFIHRQLNFVLWYFGFVQTLLYVSTGFLMVILSNLRDKIGFRATSLVSLILVGISAYALDRSVNGYMNALEADPVRPIDIGDGFKIFFSKKGEIVFFNPDCRDADLSDPFIFHLIFENPVKNALPKQLSENKDFVWKKTPVSSNFFFLSRYPQGCVHKVDPPKQKLEGFQVGRYSKDKSGAVIVSWMKYIDLENVRPLKTFAAADVNDANWSSGISKREPCLTTANSPYTRMSLGVGDRVSFPNSKALAISSLEYTPAYINVCFNGGKLDSVYDGYPTELSIRP